MGRKRGNTKNKPEEIKIYFSDYVSTILITWREKLNVNEKTANDLIEIIKKIIAESLYCSGCDNLMKDTFFYYAKSNKANRGKAILCKICWRKNYDPKSE